MIYEKDNMPTWRVGEFWSSADPRKKVLCLACADEIERWATHRSFIRWVSPEVHPRKAGDISNALDRLIGESQHGLDTLRAAHPDDLYLGLLQMEDLMLAREGVELLRGGKAPAEPTTRVSVKPNDRPPMGDTVLPDTNVEEAMRACPWQRGQCPVPAYCNDAGLCLNVSRPVAGRCPLCNYQHGHAIGCANNPVDITLAAGTDLLRRLDAALEAAWKAGTLPASVVPAALVQEVKRHLAGVAVPAKPGMPALPPAPAMNLDQFDPGERAVSIRACENYAKLYAQACLDAAACVEVDRDSDGELLIDWSPAPGRMLTMALRADGRLSYAFTWDGEKVHGTAQMPSGVAVPDGGQQ